MEAKITRRRIAQPFRRDTAHVEQTPSIAKIKRSISLSADTSRRLDVYAAMLGRNVSDVVEQLIHEPIRRFTIQDRLKKDGTSPGGGGEVSAMAVDYSSAE